MGLHQILRHLQILDVIANQSADWCGNPNPNPMPMTGIFDGERIPTPVCALARGLSRIILSKCPLMAFFSISYKVLSQRQLVKLSFL